MRHPEPDPRRDHDEASERLRRAWTALQSAAARYHACRQYGTADEITISRAAWGDSLRDWCAAIYDRESARDALQAAVHRAADLDQEMP